VRPVNLIPAEERPGGRKPLRAGPFAYIVVGALAAAVIAITALVVTNDKVADRKAEVASLESEKASVEAKAASLASYSEFSNVREQRLATITELADSRFDWERVLAELSLVLPADVQLTSLTGTVSPEATVSGGSGIGLRSQISGPALEMVGCASGQAAVAGFIEALKGIDGVTRVGLPSSTVGGEGASAETASTCGGSGRTAQFQLVAGFDAAPVPSVETGEGVAPEITVESSSEGESNSGETSSTETSSTETTSTESSTGESSEAGAD
jgi:Tfp pilus assembly protein PilN